ncbi:6-hydroxytryprostatin B O-methyltransferase [Tolypocladium ophioglossoides CBS 100239]|uniref:6-hydroxytryprostatin B O-methyltransferase n=1 Tax=Tolypocladium ophioglossoides (strain CBS 100239) TaxID=1163406 RepID=A0A0L0N3F5_TOLOC|nr:6-hydroxytryprostatin B O-methyltransferase [Tolypocladium ophioglossoides CBS 100239]
MGNSLTSPATESPLDRLIFLSREIEEKTRVLTDHLRAKGLQAPSFHPDGLADFPLAQLDTEAKEARMEVIALTKELYDLTLGPREGLKTLAWDTVSFIPLHAITEFKLAEAVPRTGSISYQDLSLEVQKIVGVDVPSFDLRRLLRLAMANNLFCEPKLGYVAHSRSSLLFLEDADLSSWVEMYMSDLFAPVAYTASAMRKWPASQEDNETGLNLAYGHSMNLFAHLQVDETRLKRYDQAMKAMGSREGFEVSHTVQSYPWDKLGGGTVVDMGGNEGFVSLAIAEAFPSLFFEVQDLPGMRTAVTNGQVPEHLAERVRLTTHDFFQEQPVVACAYLFRHIFHAFTDKYAVQILKALVPAMRPGSRVIINDILLIAPGLVSRVEEKSLRVLDVLMKTVCNSRDREINDWKSLFEQADQRFKWQGAWKSSGRMWFMEAVWEE